MIIRISRTIWIFHSVIVSMLIQCKTVKKKSGASVKKKSQPSAFNYSCFMLKRLKPMEQRTEWNEQELLPCALHVKSNEGSPNKIICILSNFGLKTPYSSTEWLNCLVQHNCQS